MLQIVHAECPNDMDGVRELLGQYAASMDLDLEFQDFSKELAGLPGDYAPPDGRLLLAVAGGRPAAWRCEGSPTASAR
ncbi:MAG TPA: hypothetical protein VIG69_16655 [Candidatus Methylomirabilis sp.]|jgi:hypothetical protein